MARDLRDGSDVPEAVGFLQGRGEVPALLRGLDWRGHQLGPPENWPPELKTAVAMMLGSQQPMFLVWGPERVYLYNDALRVQLGDRHPAALGRDWLEVWPERRERLLGLLACLSEGKTVTQSSYEVVTEHNGHAEKATYSFSFSPIAGAEGRPGGYCCFVSEITDRLSTERKLADAEKRLRTEEERVELAQQTGAILGTWDWDIANDVVIADQRFAHSFGLDRAECEAGLPIDRYLESIHPDDLQGLEAAIAAALVEGDRFTHRYRVRRADGEFQWVEALGRVEREADGKAKRFPGVLLNIEERRRQQLALQESEAKFQAIANSIDQMIWVTQSNGYHEYYNDRWYEYTGVSRGSTDGEEWNGMFHPDDQERAWAVWRHCLETGEPYHIEYRLRHRSGEYRWVIGRAQCQRDEQGAIARWYGTCTDIHDQRMAEEELLRTSSLLRLIGESTPDLIYAKDRDGRLLYANPAVGRALGRENVIGLNAYDYAVDRSEADAIMENERRIMESGETVERDELLTSEDGMQRYFRTTKAPLRASDGTTIGIAAITEDVTKRRIAEERERLLVQEVDHRAKNLLGVVQSVVQLTRAETIGAFKEAVAGRIQSLARAHSLLASERWDGVNLRSLMIEELAGFDQAGRVSISGPALRLRPAASQALALCVHELATNAAKYGALSVPGGTLEVHWEISRPDGAAWLCFSWNERGGPLAEPPSRQGFGSTVIKTSIERQLGGRLAMNWERHGLECRIEIPADQLADAAPSSEAGEGETLELTEVHMPVSGKRILIVEDEALISMQIEQVVRQLGFTALGPAGSVDQALEVLATEAVDAAVIDVSLGRERSDPLADELAERGIPFVVCTGYATPVSRSVEKAVDTLGKPIDPATLKRVLQRAVSVKP
ncbi:PAS domain S-box protein [Sphingomonas ginkgonis]|uniref:histidine kinase n=1 Tax=Sphingomonas ginkgonis TaxID=2315330 RepID=A0A3S0EM75_9SPHN|nr:PAS domain S-box protein [Sphingomonas ginkgonis]RST30724.1 PAS domain S-box protein [Sphingomonas ginkgonis]